MTIEYNKQFIRQVLFPVIRAGMGMEPLSYVVGNNEFALLRKVGNAQGILPVVWRGLGEFGMRPEWNQEMKRERMRCIYRYENRRECLEGIYSVLETASIPYVPLKGSVLQFLWPEPWMRTSSDIDVLVQEKDLDNALMAIEGGTDFRYVKRSYHDILMRGTRMHLELHFSLKEHMEATNNLLERAWEYASRCDEGFQHVFTPEYQIFHVLAHMAYHMVSGGLGIRPYLDLWLLRRKADYNKRELRRMCSESGLLTFYDVSCRLLDTWMADEKYDTVTSELERRCLSGGVFGRGDSGAGQREHRGASYVLHRLFVSREVLEGMYPNLRERPVLLPYYQTRRLLKLVNPKKRRLALNELRQQSSVSSEEISSFDLLLTSMGL